MTIPIKLNTMINFRTICIVAFLCLFTFLSCSSENDNDITTKRNNAIQFARDNSGTMSSRNWEDPYWDNLSTYISVQEYNNAMDFNQTPDLKYTLTEDSWNWTSDSLRQQFYQMRIDLK